MENHLKKFEKKFEIVKKINEKKFNELVEIEKKIYQKFNYSNGSLSEIELLISKQNKILDSL